MFSTKGWQYGRKIRIFFDSSAVMDWKVTSASIYDNIVFLLLDSLKDYSYLPIDAAHDSTNIYLNTQGLLLLYIYKKKGNVKLSNTIKRH